MKTTTTDLPALGLGLENGDRLTREEFHRRYEASGLTKAELIEGVVRMPSPVWHQAHGKQHFDLICWLGYYVVPTPGLEGGNNGTLKLDVLNEPQPDAYVIIAPAASGQVRIDDDGYIVGAPELVGEVSASTVSIDLHDKLEAYRRNEVKEYVVWRVLDKAIDWFVLRGAAFERLTADADGFIKSVVFPGLWLDAQALLGGNLMRVQQVVQLGMQSAEYAAFVQRLAPRR